MAGTFPTLSWGSSALYPVTQSLNYGVRKYEFMDGTEQRSRFGPPLTNWQAVFQGIKKADVDAIDAFRQTQKGPFDSTWTWSLAGALDGTNWTSMAFADDIWNPVHTIGDRWDLTLNFRQTQPGGGTFASGAVTDFPIIATGYTGQFPFSSTSHYFTVKNQMENGLQFAFYYRTAPLKKWPITQSLVTDAEAGTLFDFYTKCFGGWKSFNYLDQADGITYPNVRFGPAPITCVHKKLGQKQVSFLLEQFVP